MKEHVHLIGIGGAGISAIAKVLLEQGYLVSGSDRAVTPILKVLSEKGAHVYAGHDPQQILNADFIIRSSAVPDDDPEVFAAMQIGIPVLKRQDFLRTLTQGMQTIAIAGSHGKTTTTAMLVWILHNFGLDPSYISGGVIKQLGSNAHAGTGNYFVIEADEYDYMFLGLKPEIALITNIEHDHPDCFPTPADYRAAFKAFIEQVQPSGKAILCVDDAETKALMTGLSSSRINVYSYGTASDANYSAYQIQLINGYYHFDLIFKNGNGWQKKLGSVQLNVPGYHNVLNAVGALSVIHQLNLSLESAIKSLACFLGAGRRFEVLGNIDGVTVIDDYGHHPSEIAATLEAAHSRYPNHRVWAVWQPHTYTRTRNLEKEFIQALDSADNVLVLKIFAAREVDDGYSAKTIASALPSDQTVYIDNFDQAAEYLLDYLAHDDVVIVFSAGDATQLTQMLLDGLHQRRKGS